MLVTDAQSLWTTGAEALRGQVSDATWKTWFEGITPVEATDRTLVLAVPNTLVKERIEGRYLELVRDVVADASSRQLDIAIVVRTDAVRKRLAGVRPTTRRASSFGEGLYTPEIGRQTYTEALRQARKLLQAGWAVLIDGTFSTAAERQQARELASDLGRPFAILWCDAPDAVLDIRLRQRAADIRQVSDAGPELLAAHRARYEPPDGESETIRVDTTAGPDAVVAAALRALSSA